MSTETCPSAGLSKKPYLPASKKEIDDWIGRIEEITSSVSDFLHADPQQEAEEKRKREEKRKAELAEAQREKMRDRYDPARYKRFEDDEVIEKLLKEADAPPKPAHTTRTDLSHFEQISLREAERVKGEGNTAFKIGDWKKAEELYSTALGMSPADDGLMAALMNNRAQVRLNLGDAQGCVEDATGVLKLEPRNTKALFRRAKALTLLHHPEEAYNDVQKVIVADGPSNLDAQKLLDQIVVHKEEMVLFNKYHAEDPEASRQMREELIPSLKRAYEKFEKTILKREVKEDGTVVMAADSAVNEAKDKLTTSLVQVGTQLIEQGPVVHFRLLGGIEIAFKTLCHTLGLQQSATKPTFTTEEEGEPATLVKEVLRVPSSIVLLGSVLRVTALAAATPIAENQVAEHLLQKSDLSNITGAKRKGGLVPFLVQMMAAPLIVCKPAAQLITAAAHVDDFREAVVNGVTPKQMATWVNHENTAMTVEVLRMSDFLLRSPKAGVKYVATAFDVAAVVAACSGQIAIKEAGIGLLLRLSTNKEWALQFFNGPHFSKIIDLIGKVDMQQPIASPFFLEGLFAVLYNTTIAVGAGGRKAVAEKIIAGNVHKQSVAVVRRFFEAPSEVVALLNCVCRALGVLSKLVGSSVEVAQAVVDDFPLFLSVMHLMLNTARENQGSAIATHAETSSEHLTLILAALAIGEEKKFAAEIVARCMEHEQAQLIIDHIDSNNSCTVGNTALFLGVFADVSLETIERCDGATKMINAIRRLMAKSDVLEHDGERGQPAWLQAKAARRNVGIVLSKCCKNENMLQKVRDLKGFEILHAALESDK